MDPVHGRVRLTGQALVKIDVVFVVDIVFLSKPEGLLGVDSLPLEDGLFHFLRGFVTFRFISDLNLVLVIFVIVLNRLGVDLNFLFVVQINREVNEL